MLQQKVKRKDRVSAEQGALTVFLVNENLRKLRKDRKTGKVITSDLSDYVIEKLSVKWPSIEDVDGLFDYVERVIQNKLRDNPELERSIPYRR